MNTQTERVLQRCSESVHEVFSSFDLHMLIVPFRYLFGTLLVPKVATGSTKMNSFESRVVTGPSNMLFAGVFVLTFQPGTFKSWGS